MKKDEQLIMVVKTSDLFKGNSFKGFLAQNIINYESIILNNYGFMTRKFAEEDSNYKQPIAYSMIVNPDTKEIFAFQRSRQDKDYHEKRLQGKWSWGVGGHIEKMDFKDFRKINPIKSSMIREIDEEVRIDGWKQSYILGYINDDSDKIGQVHFGILYVIETNAKEIKPKDPEICEGKLRKIRELEEICASRDVESWSKFSLNPLKNHLLNNYGSY